MPESARDTIVRVAKEEGLDPNYALAVAERESKFNPNVGGTGTIKGLFQLTGKNRRGSGQAEDADTEAQVRAFARFTKNVQGEMRGVLGRDPTPGETYLGHHWGGARAANVIAGRHRDLAPGDFFTPRELAGNPHLASGTSVGRLADSITADIGRRRAKYSADTTEARNGAAPDVHEPNFAAFGQPAASSPAAIPTPQANPSPASPAPQPDYESRAIAAAPQTAAQPQAPGPPAAAPSVPPPAVQPRAAPLDPRAIDLLRRAMQPQIRPQASAAPSDPDLSAAIDFGQYGTPVAEAGQAVAQDPEKGATVGTAQGTPGQEVDLSQFGLPGAA